jgi:predicted ATP-dependent endonuclease of OLD family
MQKQINTKLVRKLVRNIAKDAIYNYSYTDKSKADNNLRNVSFFIDYSKAEAIARELRVLLTLVTK